MDQTPHDKPAHDGLLPGLLDSTLALDWHELKLQLEDLHAKLEYAHLMLRLSLHPPTQP